MGRAIALRRHDLDVLTGTVTVHQQYIELSSAAQVRTAEVTGKGSDRRYAQPSGACPNRAPADVCTSR
jgi:hypothetical protein